jgi:1-acyl-sn-glycerol-3-phosphate acyltransferase
MKKLLGQLILTVSGWKQLDPLPAYPKYVALAAPHTSNWDLLILLGFAWRSGVDMSWMGKHTLFRWPFGRIMRLLGGVPVDRRAKHNVVQQMVEQFDQRDKLVLVVPAEGTRGRADFWKSGFYHIARLAGVPIVAGALDYSRKEGSVAPPLYPSGDIRADMDKLRRFYEGKVGLHRDRMGPIRLREERLVAV